MKNKLAKICVAVTGILMAVTTQVNGAEYAPVSYYESMPPFSEHIAYNEPMSYSDTMSYNDSVSYNDPISCCEPVCCKTDSCKLLLTGELLFWRPELCGLECSFGDTEIVTTVSTDAITTTSIIETNKEPRTQWDIGFRVGLELPCECVDFDVYWTHFNGRSTHSGNTQHGHWKINYDTIDLTFGHRYHPTSCLYIKPYIGVRGAHIHQKLRSHLETLFVSPNTEDVIVFTDLNDKEDFWGIGPEIGLEANWNIGCNFSFYGSISAVTYYGNIKSTVFDVDVFTQTISVLDSHKKHCFNSLATDAEIGIRWEKSYGCFSNCELDFMIKLGLEQHRIINFSDLGSDGDLSLDGGNFGVGIGFRY